MFCSYCGQKLEDGSVFCSKCGKKLIKNAEPDSSASGINNPGTFPLQKADSESATDTQTGVFSSTSQYSKPMDEQLTKMSQIIGPNANYYISKFNDLQNGEPDKVNSAAAISTGFYHACYRNVFHEWLREMKLPFFITQVFACLLLICFAVNLMAAVCLMPVVAGMAIWYSIAQRRYARRFNRIYMEHVKQKIERNDISADPSWNRALLSVLVSFIYSAVIFLFFFMAFKAGYYDYLFSDEYNSQNSGASYDYHQDVTKIMNITIPMHQHPLKNRRMLKLQPTYRSNI